MKKLTLQSFQVFPKLNGYIFLAGSIFNIRL